MNRPKVLFIDDETDILSAFRRLFRKEPYDITVTSDPDEALDALSRDEYAVIVSDYRMPQLTGNQLLRMVREVAPYTIRIILTGYADKTAAIDAINDGGVYEFLSKPWDDAALRSTIRRAVEQYKLETENRTLHQMTQEKNAELEELTQRLEEKVIERTAEISALNNALRAGFMRSVQVMAELAEMHNHVLGSHSRRVAELSLEIAKSLALSDDECMQIEVGATLHDIGMMGVPEAILRKPRNTLTRDERNALRQHVVCGENIARMVPGIKQACDFIRHHHEHFDGTGYPDGLRGSAIPLGARIIAVANSYDTTLNSRDSYSAVTPNAAVSVIERRAGTIFDPDIVSALVHCLDGGKRALDDGIELQVHYRDLAPGMVLSRPIYTDNNTLLIAKDVCLDDKRIQHFAQYAESNPLADEIYVYRPANDDGGERTSG